MPQDTPYKASASVLGRTLNFSLIPAPVRMTIRLDRRIRLIASSIVLYCAILSRRLNLQRISKRHERDIESAALTLETSLHGGSTSLSLAVYCITLGTIDVFKSRIHDARYGGGSPGRHQRHTRASVWESSELSHTLE
jgi:hypothetical protein